MSKSDDASVRFVAKVVALEERDERWTDEVLEAASERLRFGWTQGTLAMTLSGERQSAPTQIRGRFVCLGRSRPLLVRSALTSTRGVRLSAGSQKRSGPMDAIRARSPSGTTTLVGARPR